MASIRRTLPSPLPGAELARMRDQLTPQYGSELWDQEGARVLVVRVPRDEPDLVNDLEQAVEYLAPADVAGTPHCLLLGNQKVHLVPAQLLQDLMATRVLFDKRQCAGLRPNIGPGQHRIYRAPDDPHRLPRMVVRLARPTVAELDENDFAALVKEIGPRANQSPYAEVRVVYLVADKDDVRIEADLFFQDLHGRWVEQEERHRLAAEVEAKEMAQKAARDAERGALMASLEARRREVTAVAPLKRRLPGEGPSWEADASSAAHFAGRRSSTPVADAARAEMYAHLDALRAAGDPAAVRNALWARTARRPAVADEINAALHASGRAPAASFAPPPATLDRAGADGREAAVDAAALAPAAPARPPAASPPAAAAPAPSPLLPLQARLAALKFDVLLDPPVPGIELAAERAEGYPQRLIGFAPDRLDVATAQRILASARDLDTDMALVVCAQADADAKRMFIATKARHLDPADVETLEL